MHAVDALAITGDEGRCSLRKAAGSWQASIDPQISEWGNPTLYRWLSAHAVRQKTHKGKHMGRAAMCDMGRRAMCKGSSLAEYIGY